MASNFKFRILTSANPQSQYDAIPVKDPMTFYLLNTGIGYLGSVKLFDATEAPSASITNLVTDMLDENFVANDTSAASTKAIVDYVAAKVGNASGVLTTSFFRHVESHTLTEEDIANSAISIPEGCQAGEIGLLFTADTDAQDGGENYYFIPLTKYLQNIYTPENSKSIKMTITSENKISSDLIIKEGEKSIKVDEENGGVYIDKTDIINDGDGTDEGGVAPSAAKLVTESALVAYIRNIIMPAVNQTIQDALEDVVTAVIEDGSSEE